MRRFWWFLLALLIALGVGGTLTIGDHLLTATPARLLWQLPNFQLLRYPARFNLLAVPVAALIAAASYRDWSLTRFTRPSQRWLATAVIACVVVADQAMVPFAMRYVPPAQPTAYAEILQHDPAATFLEAPLANSGSADPLASLAAYWQSFHHAPTTGGYSGCPNQPFDDRVVYGCPLSVWNLNRMGFPGPVESFDLVRNVRFADYVWLYLHANDLRYVVLHRTIGSIPTIGASNIDRVASSLPGSKRLDDGSTVVLDRNRLASPRDPVVCGLDGWGHVPFWSGPSGARVRSRAELALFIPSGASEGLILDLAGRSRRGPALLKLLTESGQTVGEAKVDESTKSSIRFPLDGLPTGRRLTLRLEVHPLGTDPRTEFHAESLELRSPAIAVREVSEVVRR
jgi:hypothetical protein